MKHEFKPGDPVMVEAEVIKMDESELFISIGKHFKASFYVDEVLVHPVPTPPRPLRVDELEEGKEYEFNSHDEGRIQGKYVTTVGTHAIMAIRYKWKNADEPCEYDEPCVVSESQNIRPVERVVSKEEVYDYFTTYRRKTADLFPECIYETVRHFMKGGGYESK